MMVDPTTEQLRNELRRLYADGSKHSVYQNVPEFVRTALGYSEKIDELWRGDTARYQYLLSKVPWAGQSVVDVGANTGFFTLSLAHRHPDARVTAVEGNPNHAAFIRRIVQLFHLDNVEVLCAYADRAGSRRLSECDVMLLLNILHHAGVDFDQGSVSDPQDVADYAVEYLRRLRTRTHRLVFQMGYDWGGNKQKPIVPAPEDARKVVYTGQLLRAAGWTIQAVAVGHATDQPPYRAYHDLPSSVIDVLNERRDEATSLPVVGGALDSQASALSKFYRRPLFLCGWT
jgi:SAM-dependent methyltransferase